jgi:hypothetical protein
MTADATPLARNQQSVAATGLALAGVAMIVDGIVAFVVEGPLERRLRAF